METGTLMKLMVSFTELLLMEKPKDLQRLVLTFVTRKVIT